MSADLLRRAASLMRERAERADGDPSGAASWYHVDEMEAALSDGVIATEAQAEKDAPHIASWHPAVALAVADWLDLLAGVTTAAALDTLTIATKANYVRALDVARAYLGESA